MHLSPARVEELANAGIGAPYDLAVSYSIDLEDRWRHLNFLANQHKLSMSPVHELNTQITQLDPTARAKWGLVILRRPLS